MVFRQFPLYQTGQVYAFLLAEILNFQGSTHRIGVGSFSILVVNFVKDMDIHLVKIGNWVNSACIWCYNAFIFD